MAERLAAYKKKRDFLQTPEPEGKIDNSGKKLLFVVQHHLASRDHFDFRLEWNGVLLSWAVPKGPSYNPRDKRLAVRVEDHPLEYRHFEGTIPKGQYGGGTVMLWDEGRWEPAGDVEARLKAGALKFILRGKRLKGRWALVRLKPKAGEKQESWLLLKEKDEYAQDDTGISRYNTSIKTGRTMEDIAAGLGNRFTRNPFSEAKAQPVKPVAYLPEKEEEWLFELKYDGYRILAFIEENNVRLITRNGHDYTKYFPQVASSLVDLAAGRAMVLDGEIVSTDTEGRSDFQALQNYLKKSGATNITYIVFDLLALDGDDLRRLPLLERKKKLEELLPQALPNLHFSRYVIGKGSESFNAACQSGLEGIVGKKINSTYSGTRNGDWIKLKCENRQEFVVGGYAVTDKKVCSVSSLLLGIYQGEDLIYVGRAGTGFTMADREELFKEFAGMTTDKCPFKNPPFPKNNEKIYWLKPELVAEIKFAQWTRDNLLRQASFKGFRKDKNPKEVIKEKAEVEEDKTRVTENKENGLVMEGIKITNPDKVIFAKPIITKADIARYYARVSTRMLPYISGRILSIVRCPKGVEQACFFKKHPGPGSRGVIAIPVANNEGEISEYFYVENLAGIISEVQMGTLEFHVWGSRVDNLEKPDMMVFDLDPDEGMSLDKVRQGVRDLKSILDELSLRSYLKTSGGKGYHVVVPFLPSASWDEFYGFARQVAEVMEQKWPDRYTSNIRKAKRKNKIFIDWIRNGRGATSIAPYSLRAREGAAVSMPIAWSELDNVAPDGINMADALVRIEGEDPWQDFLQNQQRLK